MVANVVTYRSRSAFRDVAKAMGFTPSVIDHLAAKLSYRGVRHMREELELAGALSPELPALPASDREKEDLPSLLEGEGLGEKESAPTDTGLVTLGGHPTATDSSEGDGSKHPLLTVI